MRRVGHLNRLLRALDPRSYFGNASVRTKLLCVALLPFLAVLPILLLLFFYWGGAYYDKLLTFKVSSDLAVAHQYFQRVMEHAGLDVASLGASNDLIEAIEADDRAGIRQLLAQRQTALALDFLYVLDLDGKVRVAPYGARSITGSDHTNWPVVRRAINGQHATKVDIYSSRQLRDLDPGLVPRAHLELVPTPNAAPIGRQIETRGMVIHTATPILDAHDRVLGVLEGGMLLNENLNFIDTLNDLVYTPGSLPEGSAGTATLFIDDVRIATNVRLFEGRRALGTRVSQIVRDSVLGRGQTWLDSAFVVNDWYISAYEPVEDSFGKRVGMLYVGYLEHPFRVAKEAAIALVIALFTVISGAGAFFSMRVARRIYLPLETMNATMTRFLGGDMGARSDLSDSRDELGVFSNELDGLLGTVQKQNEELKAWGDELDAKVIARTAELQRANELLIETQRQLALSEKLASIGEMTAGVAHEINNPVAVLAGNLDVVRDALSDHIEPVRKELKLMDQQIQRIHLIVTKLLQFAAPEEFAGYVQQISVDEAVSDSLVLVRHLLGHDRIEVRHGAGATRLVPINKGELQQVLINLFTNAIHAMEEHGGRLRIETVDWDEAGEPKGVMIRVADTGMGIRKEDLPRVFDAFFTRKHQRGTGLGLSISYTIVARYGGTITVESEPGVGTVFTIQLLA